MGHLAVPPRLRGKIVHALRAAADAIEAEDDGNSGFVWMHDAPDESHETDGTAVDAEFNTEWAISDEDGTYFPDLSDTSWGLYVKVQKAQVEVTREGQKATLVDAWEKKP